MALMVEEGWLVGGPLAAKSKDTRFEVRIPHHSAPNPAFDQPTLSYPQMHLLLLPCCAHTILRFSSPPKNILNSCTFKRFYTKQDCLAKNGHHEIILTCLGIIFGGYIQATAEGVGATLRESRAAVGSRDHQPLSTVLLP